MPGDPLFQGRQPLVVAEHIEVVVRQRLDVALGDRAKCAGVPPRQRAGDRRSHTRVDRVIAGGATEDEEDGRKKVLVRQPLDDSTRRGVKNRPSRSSPNPRIAERLGVEPARLRVGAPSTSVGSRCSSGDPRSPTQYRFTSSTGRRSSITAAVGPRTVVIQSASSSAFDHVADRHTSRTSVGEMQDHLLPHGSAVRVLE